MKKMILALAVLACCSAHASDQDCATVSMSRDFQNASLTLKSNQSISNLATVARGDAASAQEANWDNMIASLKVQTGCTLIGYQYRGYGINETTGRHGGFIAVWFSDLGAPATEVRDLRSLTGKISSLRCVCDMVPAPQAAPVPAPAPAPAPGSAPAPAPAP